MTVFLVPIRLWSGEWFLGVRTWQADWRPGVLESYQTVLENRRNTDYLAGQGSLQTPVSRSKSVPGLYSGPLITYITEDRKWSFSLVALRGDSGRADFVIYNTAQTLAGSSTFNLNTVSDYFGRPVRNDLDSTVSYAITDRFKVFVGYKAQEYEYNLKQSAFGRMGLTGGSQDFSSFLWGTGNLTLFNNYSGGAAGIGYTQPISDSASIGLSVGRYNARGRYRVDHEYYLGTVGAPPQNFSIYRKEHSSAALSIRAVTYEVLYTSQATEHVFVQFGVRGQLSVLSAEQTWNGYGFGTSEFGQNQSGGISGNYSGGMRFADRFHGFTISVLYRIGS